MLLCFGGLHGQIKLLSPLPTAGQNDLVWAAKGIIVPHEFHHHGDVLPGQAALLDCIQAGAEA